MAIYNALGGLGALGALDSPRAALRATLDDPDVVSVFDVLNIAIHGADLAIKCHAEWYAIRDRDLGDPVDRFAEASGALGKGTAARWCSRARVRGR